MEFDTNKKILSAIIVGGVVAYMFIAKETPHVQNEDVSKPTQKSVKKSKESVDILYLDNDKVSNTPTTSQITPKTQTYTDTSSNSDTVSNFYNDEKKIKQYIEEKRLVEITPKKQNNNGSSQTQRYSVYSTVDRKTAKQNRNTTLPPTAPAIISGTFTSGTPYTVIVDGDVKSQANELLITDNNPDGTINEAVSVPQQQLSNQETNNYNNDAQEEVKLVAPPSIGQ